MQVWFIEHRSAAFRSRSQQRTKCACFLAVQRLHTGGRELRHLPKRDAGELMFAASDPGRLQPTELVSWCSHYVIVMNLFVSRLIASIRMLAGVDP